MKISIGISTVKSNKNYAINLAKSIIANDKIDFVKSIIILSQFEDLKSNSFVSEKIKLITSNEKGLSNSRNELLNLLNGDIFWLLDDDVTVSEDCLNNIYSSFITSVDKDIIIGKIYCTDKESYFKKYTNERYGYKGVLSTSSIEIVMREKFIRNKKLFFNTKLGLGAEYPCGEENEFLVKCLNKGARIDFQNKIFVKHPSLDSLGKEDYFTTKNQIRAKKYVANVLPFKYKLFYFFKLSIYLILFKRDFLLLFELLRFKAKD